VTTTDDGTVAITLVGTESGTFVYSTITTDGDEETKMIYVDGNDETNEIGTTTGLDHVEGTVTVFGTLTLTLTLTLGATTVGTFGTATLGAEHAALETYETGMITYELGTDTEAGINDGTDQTDDGGVYV
jgi:hypothetical protein